MQSITEQYRIFWQLLHCQWISVSRGCSHYRALKRFKFHEYLLMQTTFYEVTIWLTEQIPLKMAVRCSPKIWEWYPVLNRLDVSNDIFFLLWILSGSSTIYSRIEQIIIIIIIMMMFRGTYTWTYMYYLALSWWWVWCWISGRPHTTLHTCTGTTFTTHNTVDNTEWITFRRWEYCIAKKKSILA